MLRKLQAHLPLRMSELIENRLSLYSLGAVTTGVSLLALAPLAEGSIVVTQTSVNVANGTPAFIDINNDGIIDFEFSVARGGYDHSFYNTLAVIPLTGGKPVGGARGPLGPYGSALVKGANIGPTAHFSSSVARGQVTLERTNGAVSGSSTYQAYGQWGINNTTHYLGVKFLINGVTHYGWIKLSTGRNTAFITEYAYETVANKAIGAGNTAAAEEAHSIDLQAPSSHVQATSSRVEANDAKPSGPSLGMLAAGADGLSLWRR